MGKSSLTCSIVGCEARHHAKGYCLKHYRHHAASTSTMQKIRQRTREWNYAHRAAKGAVPLTDPKRMMCKAYASMRWLMPKREVLSEEERRSKRISYKREAKKRRKARDPVFRWWAHAKRRHAKLLKGTHLTPSQALGCTRDELRQHIEAQFVDGMSWDDRQGWHIDHVIPTAAITSANVDAKIVCHYTNLRPMWAEDNRAKGDAYSDCEMH